jgi:putative ABC transport system permease protein
MTPNGAGWAAAWRIARRGLDWRFRGLRLLIVCLALGTAALSAILTLTATISHELAARGNLLLGGDVEVAIANRPANAEELGALDQLGTVSGGTRLQAMAHAPGDLARAAPVELKAVDAKWPLYGSLKLVDGRAPGAPAGMTAWIAPGAADRLGLRKGDRLQVGDAVLTVGGVIADEPDRLGEGFALGPTVIVSKAALDASHLVLPGSMTRNKYRVRLPSGESAGSALAAAASIKARFPDAGFEIRTRDAASPGLDKFVGRMGEFLQLVALAALAIAGIGIAQGVASYCAGRRASLATLKVLGATGGDIARIVVMEIAVAAALGVVAGLIVGVLVTPLIAQALRSVLPISTGLVIDPRALLISASYGLLIALTFAAPPLAAVRSVPAMAVFRAGVDPSRASRWGGWPVVLAGLVGIALIAIGTAEKPLLAAGFLGGAAAMFGLLALFGMCVTRLARTAPRPKGTIARMALANLHRPGAQTAALVLAIGFGLSAFVLLAAVETSLDANIARRVPEKAPDYFVVDLPKDRAEAFTQAVRTAAPQAAVRMVPALRGTIVAYGPAERMTRVADLARIPDEAWPLRGDRGLTYSDAVPEGNVVTAGSWWPRDYAGEPLVSIDEKLAKVLNLRIGDRLAISLLGIERSAKIASLRRIDWDSMGFNYVLVFSPNTLADAPHSMAATVNLGAGEKRADVQRGLLSALVRGFPTASVIEVGPVLGQARSILGQMSAAILAAASVAILAGLAVLAGAIASTRERRAYDTVILRVLGASRGQLIGLLLAEYGALTLATALVSLALGLALAWLVIVQLFAFDWLPGWGSILGVLGGGAGLVMVLAVLGSLGVLRTRPAQALREL